MLTAARPSEGPGGVSLRDTTMTSATRATELPEPAGARRLLPTHARPLRIAANPRSGSAKRDRAQPAHRRQRTSAWREGKRPGWAAPAV
jgi:hypothetical protein